MESKLVHSHHVFLALLDYQEAREDANVGSIATTATDSNEVCRFLLSMGVLETNSALDICSMLVASLNYDRRTTNRPTQSPFWSTKNDVSVDKKAENPSSPLILSDVETIGKDAKKMNDKIGINLAEQARLGLLDCVHGRDAEIRAADAIAATCRADW
jgi:ATP-dependent Clp protease ATP-binding subunit ClpA